VTDLADKVREEVHRVDFGLRLIIVWKCIKATLMIALGVTALVLAQRDLQALALDVVTFLRIDPARPFVAKVLAKLTGLTSTHVVLIGVGALVYAGILALQAWGLHRRRMWAEWLTVIVTSSLIPIEIYEVIRHASLAKAIALGVNIAIVMYLLRHRWLFRR
jgi:uncharacterized membrane protein (DUF2068 family)